MNTAIITSQKDTAGTNIKQQLLELFDFKKTNENFDDNPVYELNIKDKKIKLYTINDDTIYAENLDKKINADLFIFATRHSAKAGVKTLCLHTPGNWNKAEAGGKEKQLCTVAPSYLKDAFLILNDLAKDLDYEKTLEVTHHGPYIGKPCFFIEIGSSEQEWKDKNAAEIIAKTIIKLLEKERRQYKVALGIGGPHYAAAFNKILLKTDIAIGHICPKYALQHLDEEMILQAIEKTNEKVDFVLLDWKGLGKEKQRIVDLLEKLNIKYERSDKS